MERLLKYRQKISMCELPKNLQNSLKGLWKIIKKLVFFFAKNEKPKSSAALDSMQHEPQGSGILPDLTPNVLWKVKSAPDKGRAFRETIISVRGTFTAELSENNLKFLRAVYIFGKRVRVLSYLNGN